MSCLMIGKCTNSFIKAGSASIRFCAVMRGSLFIRATAILFGVTLPQLAGAQEIEPGIHETLAREYVEAFVRHELTNSRGRQMPGLLSRVQLMAPTPTAPGKADSNASLLQIVDHELLREVAPSIKNSVAAETQHIASAIDDLSTKLANELQRAQTDWTSVRSLRIERQIEALEMASAGNMAAQIATLLNARNQWLWFGAVLSAAGLIITGWYTRRHYFRRLFWVRKNKYRFLIVSLGFLLLILIIPGVIIFLTGDMAYHSLVEATVAESPISKEQRLIEQLVQAPHLVEFERQIAESDEQLKSIVANLESSLGGVVLPNQRSAIYESVRVLRLVVDLRAHHDLLRKIADEDEGFAANDRKLLAEAQTNIKDNAGLLQRSRKQSYQTAAVLGLGLLSLFGAAGIYLLKTEVTERSGRRKTCPQCYTKNSMTLVTNKNGVSNLVCSAEIEDEMGMSEPCGFSYEESNGELPKLMFPTLGINATGKTHWMAMNYRQLNFGNAPAGVRFERLKSDKAEEFDEKIRLLLENRSAFEATYHTKGFVHPLMFVLQDADSLPFSETQLIANLLDLGGIVTRERNHPLRNSALNGHGFLFFLDPTRNVDEQNEALNLFREDVRMTQKLRPHQQMQRPLAICVSKIDLIGTEAYVGPLPGVAQEFYRSLREVDASNPPLSMSLIRARHEIMSSYVQTLFPGWDVLKSVESLFGPRVSFFPLTPVGLQGVGVDSFARVSQDPYAILEPLLWLIHMNGYPVLR